MDALGGLGVGVMLKVSITDPSHIDLAEAIANPG
jgi:hypothetical protein